MCFYLILQQKKSANTLKKGGVIFHLPKVSVTLLPPALVVSTWFSPPSPLRTAVLESSRFGAKNARIYDIYL